MSEPTLFVAMPFSDEFWPVWETIDAAARTAGARALRVDLIPQVDNIHEAIFREIERSAAIVADLTGANANVAMEVQHARNHRRPVILITQDPNRMPFDLKLYRAIVYSNSPESRAILGQRLSDSIRAALAVAAPAPAAAPSRASPPARARAAAVPRQEPERREEQPSGFTYLRDETFECGGACHTVGIYRFEPFAQAMGNLLPEGGTDPACEFVLIPAGEFLMGSKELQNTQPVHKVSVPSFFMARMPVIRLVWDGCSHMRYYPREKITTSTGDRRPIEGVSWEEIGPFLKFTGLRLPTESEWEYACRAGTTTRYSFGEDAVVKTGFFARKNLLAEYAWYGENSRYGKDVACAVHPVGQKLPNAFGLCEMHGNVWELCEDTYAPNYNQHPTDGSAAIGVGCDRVTRGGSSWSEARALASAWRQSFAPPRHLTYGGFRVAARP